ncbi:ventral homeobox [Myripristis murdjan]|uniref:ventral homeobox n=1 Tax=Myripristis murdjan TaxID=586833 RepID=UPI001176332A|nr:homeobox protein vent1-like [Myripristis murdjan]
MVKHFSVDWLAQSHYSSEPKEDYGAVVDGTQTHRPHIPCMVQPRPPTCYGKGYLQAKPKSAERMDSVEDVSPQESSLSSPFHPASCASPISEVSGYSSGYESEAASSECLSVDEGSEVERDGPQRRVRTKFTPEQINKLEKIFSKHKYLDAGERVKTAQKLNLTETQVRTWFQNRRMKLKREVQDYLAPPMPPAMFQSLPPVQYHSLVGQRLQYSLPSQPFFPAPVPQLVLQPQIASHQPQHLMIHNPQFY